MPELRISPRADLDLIDVWFYIARDSESAADGVLDDIYDAAERASDTPEIGHRRSDVADPTLRFLTVHSYLIVYRVDESTLDVIRILSGYQDIGTLLCD